MKAGHDDFHLHPGPIPGVPVFSRRRLTSGICGCLRAALKKQLFRTALEIQKHFPAQTRLAVPQGGSLLWVQLPRGGRRAGCLPSGRSIGTSRSSPGAVCSNSETLQPITSRSAAPCPFSKKIQAALGVLGSIVAELAQSPSK
ncbi:MAG: hypothetical protein MZU95_00180 [Desulfomicrobium escambiense]|nr:hypothetical protein [Desulfomicrobium escambiense]